jgi:rod shape-determining protein MreC
MKTRIAVIVVLLMTLAILLMRNDERILNTLLAVINPLKQQYVVFTEKLENESRSYLFQKETIDRLRKENLRLQKELLKQTHYHKQIEEVRKILPSLKTYDPEDVVPVHTISYVKLNAFSQILLTRPKGLETDRIYGLLEEGSVAGIAMLQHGQLYGYLVSDERCRFAVYIGDEHAPGIAEGAGKDRMIVKFVPKWYDIKPGDAVITSGLDRIFYSSLPVGTVISVRTESAYKVATVKTLVDVYHPKIFFLIKNAEKNILDNFDGSYKPVADTNESNMTQTVTLETARTENSASSLSVQNEKENETILQTRDDIVQPSAPVEEKPKKKRKPRRIKRRLESTPLDLF